MRQILHLNIASLNKLTDILSNGLISMMKFKFPIIVLSEHKIRSNSYISNISLSGYKAKSTHDGTVLLFST